MWTSIFVFSSLGTALNNIFQVKKGHGIIWGIGVDLLMMLLVGSLHLANMTLTPVMIYLKRHRFNFKSPLGLGAIIGFSLKYILPFFSSFWMFFLIYKIIPNKKINFKTALQAALFTSKILQF